MVNSPQKIDIHFSSEAVAVSPLTLARIPPGTFLMGSPFDEEGRDAENEAQFLATISRGFWMSDAPITQGQWYAVMGGNPSSFEDSCLERPVESVNWLDAM